ncbi:MAG: aminoglycoside adenylyltransferase domain-containing protein [Solirubrobacteraceae bacterium]
MTSKFPGSQRGGESRLPPVVAERVDDLLARLDRGLPGRVEGFYVVGSACLGAFREGRSDIDFVAIVDGRLDPDELRRLRTIHLGRWAGALVHDAVLRQRWPLVCNGSYLSRGALSRSPLEVRALAGHVAGQFAVAPARGFDVNPVTWHVLARHGIAVRGPEPERLEIWGDPAELRAWTRGNLDGYWRDWIERARRRFGAVHVRALPRRFAAWGVLGVSRLHYTLATAEIVDKEAAGEYALTTFGPEWRELIEEALAFWRGAPPPRGRSLRNPTWRTRRAADFVAHVIDASPAVKDSARNRG